MKHKVITRCARRAERYCGHLTRPWKSSAHRAYRRRVHQIDHLAEDVNYEPTRRTRVTAWDVA